MYKLEVAPHGAFWMFRIISNEMEVMRGFRASEAEANRAGSEELRFCRLFSIGRFDPPPQNEGP